MKADLYLPIALAGALAAMGIYAATGSNKKTAELTVTPLDCKVDSGLVAMAELSEASGLAVAGGGAPLLWAHNDSGQPTIYAVAEDGSVRARVRVAGASVGDWEAVTTAPCAEGSCLYVGDIG